MQDFTPDGSRFFVYWAIAFSVMDQGVIVISSTYVTQVQCQMSEVYDQIVETGHNQIGNCA